MNEELERKEGLRLKADLFESVPELGKSWKSPDVQAVLDKYYAARQAYADYCIRTGKSYY